jgi:toxin-antitoxin system PIN domain toxin
VNVWVALISRRHVHSELCGAWLSSLNESNEVFFCRVSQIGLLRLLTSATVMREDVLSSRKAWNVYHSVLEDNRIQFAPEPFLLEQEWQKLSSFDRPTPKVWTDAYLTAFARVTGMRLVTMDRAVAANASETLLLA